MSNRTQVIYVITHEAKLDGKWQKTGRAFSLWEDAEKEKANLQWFAEKSAPKIVRRVSDIQGIVAYL